MKDGTARTHPHPMREQAIQHGEEIDLRVSARAAVLAAGAFVGVMHVLPMLLELARQAAP